MEVNSPAPAPRRQPFLRRVLSVILASARVLGRRDTWGKILRAVDFLLSNEIYTYASAIAFNAIIAFFPAAIVVLTVVNAWGGKQLHAAALAAIIDYLPANREFFAGQLMKVTVNFSGMTFVSLAILLVSAVGIFIPVELALNFVWKIPKPRHWLASQAISFVLLATIIVLALVPIGLSWAFGRVLETGLFFLKGTAFLAWCEWLFLKLVTVPVTILAFAIVFATLPGRRMRLEEVVPAALASGLAFEAGKYGYIVALPLLNLREMYGAFSVSVTFITWALFAALIMLMGVYLTAQDLLPRVVWRRRSAEELPPN